MLNRHQILTHLLSLGFTSEGDRLALTYAGIHVQLLNAPRIAATSPKGLAYLAVLSGAQLEEQLTSLCGYQRPLG